MNDERITIMATNAKNRLERVKRLALIRNDAQHLIDNFRDQILDTVTPNSIPIWITVFKDEPIMLKMLKRFKQTVQDESVDSR